MALVRIGRMDRQITLRQRVVTRGAAGSVVESWQNVATVWAEKLDMAGREFMAAQQSNAEISTKFRIRYYADITPEWRISHDGKDYDIISIAELGRRQWQEIMASAVASEEIDP